MKLISKKTAKNRVKIIANCEFDADIISHIERYDTEHYIMEYGIEVIGNPLSLPFKCKKVRMCIQISRENIYANAMIDFANDEEFIEFEQICENGQAEFDIVFSENEKIKLLILLLNKNDK